MVKFGRHKREEPRSKSPPPAPASSVRTGGRIKKAKVVFDPSDNYLPKKFKKDDSGSGRKNDSSPSSPESHNVGRPPAQKSAIKEDLKRKEPEEQCSLCSKYEPKRLKLLIFCLDCNYRVHPKCLSINYVDFNTLKEKYRCDECTTCVKCYEGNDDGPMATCKFCISSYHFKCHVPEVNKKNSDMDDWTCFKCSGKKDLNKRRSRHLISDENHSKSSEPNFEVLSISSQSSVISKQEPLDDYPDPSATPAQISARGIKHTKDFPENIPTNMEVQGWSTQKIHKFFEKAFPDESKFITNNEIDGQALLLLTREDVVSRELPWKLGGLLKFYNAIAKIQNNTKKKDVTWS